MRRILQLKSRKQHQKQSRLLLISDSEAIKRKLTQQAEKTKVNVSDPGREMRRHFDQTSYNETEKLTDNILSIKKIKTKTSS